jgi:PilZ domain-containing protein
VTKKTADERRSARANVLLVGTVECGGVQIRVRIANLSAHGALVVADGLPAEGTQLTLRCNGATVQSWIAWVRTPHAGIQFGEPIDPDELLRNAPPAQAQMITRDNRKVDFRRPGFRGNQLTAEERKIVDEQTDPEPRPEK